MAKIPMDKLFEVPPHEDAPDYARDLGQGIIESVLGLVADKAKRLATESVVEGRADGLDQLVAAAERLRALRSVLGGESETKAGNGDERLARDLVSKADPMSGTAQAQHKGKPLALDFKGLQLHLPPYLYAYFAMGMRSMGRPETGEGYPFTAQGIADYVTDFLRYSHEVRLPQFLKLKRHEIESVEGRRALAAVIAAIEGLTGDDLAAVVQRILEAGEDQDHGEDTHGQAV